MNKLTADQSARLDALTARDDLNASEEAELNFLQSLAPPSEESAPAEVPESDLAEDAPEEPGAEAPEDSDESEDDAPEDPAPADRLNIFQRAEAVLKSKATLAGNVSVLKDELAAAQDRITTLEAENVKLAAQASQGKALAKRVAELESDQMSVSRKAAQIAANNHVSDADLPESSEEIETLDDVRAQLAQETDPKRKGELAKKAKLLREAPAKTHGLN